MSVHLQLGWISSINLVNSYNNSINDKARDPALTLIRQNCPNSINDQPVSFCNWQMNPPYSAAQYFYMMLKLLLFNSLCFKYCRKSKLDLEMNSCHCFLLSVVKCFTILMNAWKWKNLLHFTNLDYCFLFWWSVFVLL